jgi:hypothetical protein
MPRIGRPSPVARHPSGGRDCPSIVDSLAARVIDAPKALVGDVSMRDSANTSDALNDNAVPNKSVTAPMRTFVITPGDG